MTIETAQKVEPCPCCKQTPEVSFQDYRGIYRAHGYAKCGTDQCLLQGQTFSLTRWNRRL